MRFYGGVSANGEPAFLELLDSHEQLISDKLVTIENQEGRRFVCRVLDRTPSA